MVFGTRRSLPYAYVLHKCSEHAVNRFDGFGGSWGVLQQRRKVWGTCHGFPDGNEGSCTLETQYTLTIRHLDGSGSWETQRTLIRAQATSSCCARNCFVEDREQSRGFGEFRPPAQRESKLAASMHKLPTPYRLASLSAPHFQTATSNIA